MAISISVKGEIREVIRELNQLQRTVVPKAVNRAINRTAAQVKTQASREIQKETKLKQRFIKKRIEIKRSSFKTLTAKVIGLRGAPNLAEWVDKRQLTTGRPRPRTKRARDGGVTAKAWGKRKVYKGTFVGGGSNSGKLLVFTRQGKKLKVIYGPSVRRTFMEKTIERVMERTAEVRFRQNFDRELKYYLSKL